jgi:ketosteroid isomerase-like protein
VKNAKELLLEFAASSFREPQKAGAMFAEDGAFEMPYLADFGFSPRYVGEEEIARFFQTVRDLYPEFEFENVRVLIDTPTQVFSEYEFTAVSSKTGRTIHQLFFGYLVAENGKIKLLREALNSAELARAIYSHGIPDLPRKSSELQKASEG